MTSASASERLVRGLTLHRSETVAHITDIFDQKGASRASTRARGRCEGHQSKPNSIFKPLGCPVKNEHFVEMNTAKLSRVEKTAAMVVASVGSHNHDVRPRALSAEHSASQSASARSKGGDLGLEDDKSETAAEAERAQQQRLMRLPHGLFGHDLPRCKFQGARHNMDGFSALRQSVRESEERMQKIKTDCVGNIHGFDFSSTVALLPPRERYPPQMHEEALGIYSSFGMDVEAIVPSAASTGGSMSARTMSKRQPKLVPMPPSQPRLGGSVRPPPHSARTTVPKFQHPADHVSSLERRTGRQPNRLQSLDEFIASSGPVMGRSERSEALRLREQINLLLGLEKHVTLKLPLQEEGVRRGRLDVKRRIERRMDEVWNNRTFLKQCTSVPKDTMERIASIERALHDEVLEAESNKESNNKDPKLVKESMTRVAELATIERYLRDLLASSDDRPSGAEPERTLAAASATAEERGATGVEWAPEGAAERRRERQEADEAAKSATKIAAQLAKLRTTLQAYQASRVERGGELREVLVSMDTNRPHLLRRRAALGSPSGPAEGRGFTASGRDSDPDPLDEEGLPKQHAWYWELLCRVQDHKHHLPRVVHYIFDCVRQVLEYGEEFGREVFFAMLQHIQSFEFSKLIAGLVVNMIRGIDGVSMRDLIAWFEQQRSEVPRTILELADDDSGDSGSTGEGGGGVVPPLPPLPRAGLLTFVTEMP